MTTAFTAHNVMFSNGEQTVPDLGWFIADSPWLHAARSMVNLIYPAGPRECAIVDLGCLEDGYTLEFARLGMQATGIEIRQSNIQ